jgi:hypothetical protein
MKPIEQKRREGEARNEYWRELSPADQLRVLDRRLGVGQGAKRQRAAIQRRIK